MANQLKHMILKSVDLVRRGANPDADIKLYKSADAPNPVLKTAEEVDVMVEKSQEVPLSIHTDLSSLLRVLHFQHSYKTSKQATSEGLRIC